MGFGYKAIVAKFPTKSGNCCW